MDIDGKNFEAVIFDMDGVLVNSEPFYVEMEKKNFNMLGLDISDEEHQTYQGTASDYMWKTIIQKHHLDKPLEELVKMTNSLVTPFFQSLPYIDPMPGVKELIEFLHTRGVPFALASSSYPDVIQIILEKTGLKPFFNVIVDSLMAGKSKPEPDIFLLAAIQLGVNPENCLVIEDSANGIEAARRAGMFCVAFNGPGAEFQDQSKAGRIISDFEEVRSLF